jgi:MoxR-like ATPase
MTAFRDDDQARAAYVAALERKAARVDELEARIRDLEAELARLRTLVPATPDLDAADIYVDAKIVDYVSALVRATEPGRTDGILSGARSSDGEAIVVAACQRARDAGRRYVVPDDVRHVALVVLPGSIVMQRPDADPREIVRAILDVVEVP